MPAFFGYCMVSRPEIQGEFPLERANYLVKVATCLQGEGKKALMVIGIDMELCIRNRHSLNPDFMCNVAGTARRP